MQHTPHPGPRRPNRRLAALAVGLMMVSFATAATAQTSSSAVGVPVTMSVGSVGTRALTVTNFTGTEALTALPLVSGAPTNYRATVTDLDYVIDRDFDVVAEMGNLYPVTSTGEEPLAVDTASEDIIASGDVTLGLFQGLTATDVLADIQPTYLLSLVGTATCVADLTATLESVLAALSPELVAALAALPDLCTAFDDAVTAAAPATELAGTLIEDLDLTGLIDEALGLVDGITGTQPFTDPSFLGLGSTDADAAGAPAATMLTLMRADAPVDLALLTDLIDAINAQLTDLTGLSATDVIDANDIIQGLVNSTDTTIAALGNEIAGLGNTLAQEAILDDLLSIVNGAIDLSVLDNLFGVYTAFPRITATAPTGTPAGSYAGTHTITLISQ